MTLEKGNEDTELVMRKQRGSQGGDRMERRCKGVPRNWHDEATQGLRKEVARRSKRLDHHGRSEVDEHHSIQLRALRSTTKGNVPK
jgi:hypothetical protein